MSIAYRCPLCGEARVERRHEDRRRLYLLCSTCELLFVPEEYHLSAAEERAEYDLHQNSPDDPGYRGFLEQLCEPMCERLAPGSRGLDFGSGPGPTLSLMLEERGHRVALYDLFYANQPEVFDESYDFITASEVVEHLHRPGFELCRLWSCLKEGGWLGIMTQLWCEQPSFETWRYKNDATHVSFFSAHSFQWLAQRWGAQLHVLNRNVRLLQKL